MSQDHKQAVRRRLDELGLTQAQLAQQLGTTPGILSRTLGTPMVRPDSHWPAVLRALGLEVVVRVADEPERPA